MLHDHTHPLPGKRMGLPIVGAVEAMCALEEAGHELVVFTVRADRPQHVVDWLNFYEIPFARVTNIKEPFDFILDDHAVAFTSWRAFLEST